MTCSFRSSRKRETTVVRENLKIYLMIQPKKKCSSKKCRSHRYNHGHSHKHCHSQMAQHQDYMIITVIFVLWQYFSAFFVDSEQSWTNILMQPTCSVMTVSGALLSPNNELFGNLNPMSEFSSLPPIVKLARVLAVLFPTATLKFFVCIIVKSSSETFLALVVARSMSREFTNLFVCSFVSAKLFAWFFVSTTYCQITTKYNFGFNYI